MKTIEELDTISKKTGRQLKSLRVLKGYTIDRVMELTGLHHNTIVAIESGRYNTGIRQIVAYAYAIGYDFVLQPLPTT